MHPAPEARRDHARDRIDRHHLHRRDLLGGLHQADLGGDGGAGAAREEQAGHDRAELAHERQRHQHAERLRGAEALQRVVALQGEHHADEQPRDHDDDERQHAGEVDLGDGEAEAPQRRAGVKHECSKERGWRSPARQTYEVTALPRRSRRPLACSQICASDISAPGQLELGGVVGRRVVERHRPVELAVHELAHERARGSRGSRPACLRRSRARRP